MMPPESKEPEQGLGRTDARQPLVDGAGPAGLASSPVTVTGPGAAAAPIDFGPSLAGSTAFQLLALAISNGVVLFVVWLIHKTTEPHKPIPALFVASSLTIVGVSVVLMGFGEILRNISLLTNDAVSDEEEMSRLISAQPEGLGAWWLKHRVRVQRRFVVLLSALMVFGLDRLVHTTGGGTRSPFMPLLEAPAVLGPFIATNWRGVVLSAGAVSGAVWYEIHTGPLPQGSEYGRTSHAVVVILAIAVAALISAAQKSVKSRRIKKTQEARAIASGHSMFIIMLTYLKPLDEIGRTIHRHDAHVDRNQAAGLFLASGRQVSQTGVVILARAASLREVEEATEEDPLVTEGAARCEIVEFQPTKRAVRATMLQQLV
jgi:uncharacterized protein YciI